MHAMRTLSELVFKSMLFLTTIILQIIIYDKQYEIDFVRLENKYIDKVLNVYFYVYVEKQELYTEKSCWTWDFLNRRNVSGRMAALYVVRA